MENALESYVRSTKLSTQVHREHFNYKLKDRNRVKTQLKRTTVILGAYERQCSLLDNIMRGLDDSRNLKDILAVYKSTSNDIEKSGIFYSFINICY